MLGAPQTGAYPTIHFQLDAYDARGSFLDNLKISDVLVQEDDQALKPRAFEKIQNGLQTILVINTSPEMANQVNGTNEYARIQQALIDWAKTQKTVTAGQRSTSDFSLSTPTGLFLIRESNPDLLAQALLDYQPDLAKMQPTTTGLSEALDLATDPLSQPFMKRAILFITPALPASSTAAIEDLMNRAQGVGVRINIWQVKANGAPETQENPLRRLAERTGGLYAEILPSGPLPPVEDAFQPLRYTYQVTYTSIIKNSGTHRLSVQVNRNGQTLDSNESKFSLTVVAPNPIFLSPPNTVQRTWTLAEKNNPAVLTPNEVRLQILVEFPDQFQRELKASRLYVNDQVVDENTRKPFDQFTWAIDDLTVSARQTLRVEVDDSLGLTGSSIEVPIDVVVDQPASNSISDRFSTSGMIAIGAVTAAGAVLAAVLVLSGNRRRVRRKPQADLRKNNDPLTQPVSIRQDDLQPKKSSSPSARAAASLSNAVWTRPGGQNAAARLVTLDESEQPVTGGAIPLQRQEVTFGTDPRRATQVLNSPTVDGLHARLTRTAEGDFILADQNSVAGTWINYAPVTSAGARLEHGDLIHIGKVMFRFEMNDVSRIRPVEAKVYNLDKPA